MIKIIPPTPPPLSSGSTSALSLVCSLCCCPSPQLRLFPFSGGSCFDAAPRLESIDLAVSDVLGQAFFEAFSLFLGFKTLAKIFCFWKKGSYSACWTGMGGGACYTGPSLCTVSRSRHLGIGSWTSKQNRTETWVPQSDLDL